MKQSKAAVKAPDTSTPYLAARQEWNERYGSYVSSAAAWKLTAIASMFVSIVAVCGVVYIGAQSKIVPYIVQVDKLGNAVMSGRAEVAGPVDPRVVRSTLARWVSNVRSVYVDAGAQRTILKEAYATINRRGPSYNALNDYFRKNEPFERAKNESVTVTVQPPQPLSENTWRVEWQEERRGRDGALLDTEPKLMQAVVTIVIEPPTDDEKALVNPLGIYINSFNWSPRL
ncbi:conjugal transfer protein TrbF (plasmid) [Pseudomonas viciae]|uniref:Conjugal transfer protein TrbF n=1 Tax=Pseudomonas viciae TaxID=2505979 RepID=A0ABY8PMI4_9PSED|nr:conjugal transfer protein TrbF [Pseudomonas viciae]WGO96439.1 conjugal transfer protein TrbF [Pseudomonas viciae]